MEARCHSARANEDGVEATAIDAGFVALRTVRRGHEARCRPREAIKRGVRKPRAERRRQPVRDASQLSPASLLTHSLATPVAAIRGCRPAPRSRRRSAPGPSLAPTSQRCHASDRIRRRGHSRKKRLVRRLRERPRVRDRVEPRTCHDFAPLDLVEALQRHEVSPSSRTTRPSDVPRAHPSSTAGRSARRSSSVFATIPSRRRRQIASPSVTAQMHGPSHAIRPTSCVERMARRPGTIAWRPSRCQP